MHRARLRSAFGVALVGLFAGGDPARAQTTPYGAAFLDPTATPRAEEPRDRSLRDYSAYRAIFVPERHEIAHYVEYFTTSPKGRATFEAWMRRVPRYTEMVRATLEREGLPEDLLAVALIESGLDPDAVSPAGATGMWQFIQDTARVYGLRIDEERDERRDPALATNAAARHLRDLHDLFGDWPLALAAYNAGATRVQEFISETGSRDFWTIAAQSQSIPEETAKYVPKVLAAVSLLRDVRARSLSTTIPLPGVRSDAEPRDATAMFVDAPPGTSLGAIARALNLETRELTRLNPVLVGSSVPAAPGNQVAIPKDRLRLAELLVPEAGPADARLLARVARVGAATPTPRPGHACRFGPCVLEGDREAWDRLLEALGDGASRTYRIRSGDTLQKVADTFGVDARQLMDANQVRDARRLRVGELLRLPMGVKQL